MAERREAEPGMEEYEFEKTIERITARERLERIVQICKDDEVRAGLAALLRTVINTGVTVADAFPGAGDAVSWTADGAKFLAHRFDISLLDTSPDVSEKLAYGSELVELVTAGLFPSHAIETTIQFSADYPRLKRAYEKIQRIWKMDKELITTPRVQEAMDVFAIETSE